MVLLGGRLVELGFIAAIDAKCAHGPPTASVTPSLTPTEEWSSLEWGSSFLAMIELATERKTTPITARQREVVALIAAGYSNDEVGARLGISPRTAKAHCDVLRHKLGVRRRRQIPIAFRLLTGEDPLSSGHRYLKAAGLPR
jgi:DNA-binding CsgD family transcriptional regulator